MAAVHNVNRPTSHHDIILTAHRDDRKVSIAVQSKVSFDCLDRSTIEAQLLVSKQQRETVPQQFWLYLGKAQGERRYMKVAFPSRNGCCNGLAWSLFVLVKRLSMRS
jgi:hypothetical protein